MLSVSIAALLLALAEDSSEAALLLALAEDSSEAASLSAVGNLGGGASISTGYASSGTQTLASCGRMGLIVDIRNLTVRPP